MNHKIVIVNAYHEKIKHGVLSLHPKEMLEQAQGT
jgi:hypothetical protein